MTHTLASRVSGRIPGLVSAVFAAIAMIAILATARPALAWSPGPYGFDRCVAEFDTAIGGRVTKVEEVGSKPGGWTLSRAHVEVRRVYRGLDANAKRTSFYFWSATDNQLTLAHSLRRGALILAFLSTDLSPIGDITLSGKTGYFLQFAKANHRGYLYFVDGESTERKLRDAIVRDDKAPTLAAAERALPPLRAAPASGVEGGVEGGVVGGVVGGVPGGVVGGVTPSSRLTRGEIVRVMRSAKRRVQRCHERALRSDPSIGGSLVVKLDIGANGTVRSAKIHRSAISNAAMETCVLRVVRRLRFPANGPLTISYPFVFQASAAGSSTASGGSRSTRRSRRSPRAAARVTLRGVTGKLGPLTRDQARRPLRQRVGLLRACFQRALSRAPSRGGAFVVELRVGADGRVSRVDEVAVTTSVSNARFTGCATRMLRRTRFSGGPATIEARFELSVPSAP